MSRPDSYCGRADLRFVERAFSGSREEPLAHVYTLYGGVTILAGIAALNEEGLCHPSRCISLMRWRAADWIRRVRVENYINLVLPILI